jgi:hypothetical protein
VCWLSIDDLFTAGIGLDLAGAYLLGRGLLASHVDIARRTVHVWAGPGNRLNDPEALAQLRNRLDAQLGISSLVAGFSLQAIAYALLIATGTTVSESVAAGAVAMAFALVTAGTVLLIGRTRWPRQSQRSPSQAYLALDRAAIVKLAHADPIDGSMKALPDGETLLELGQEAGYMPEVTADGGLESAADYAKRVFNVDAVEDRWSSR